MHRPVVVYISAASDLISEREILARMIAGLPVTLVWRILQTPLGDELLDLAALQVADLHYLIIGGDIRAPVGLEWRAAYNSGQLTIPFLKTAIARTPAGQNFVREIGVTWRAFQSGADLRRQAQRALINFLLDHTFDYQLTPLEIEQLQAQNAVEANDDKSPDRQEAGHSAVILSRERYEPGSGVLIGDSDSRI